LPGYTLEFDGRNDALLNLRPDHVLADDGVILPHIDHILSKESRALPAFLHIMRLYAMFLRQHCSSFSRARRPPGVDRSASAHKRRHNDGADGQVEDFHALLVCKGGGGGGEVLRLPR
jgi:hypothetical protein